MHALQLLESEVVPAAGGYIDLGTVNSLLKAVAQCMGSVNKVCSRRSVFA